MVTQEMAESLISFCTSSAVSEKYKLFIEIAEQKEKSEAEIAKKCHRGGHHSKPEVKRKITKEAKIAYDRVKSGQSGITEEGAKLGITYVGLVNRWRTRGWDNPLTGKPYGTNKK